MMMVITVYAAVFSRSRLLVIDPTVQLAVVDYPLLHIRVTWGARRMSTAD